MERRLLFLLILVNSFLTGNSQRISVSGAVFNVKERKCIPYVNIRVAGSSYSVDADENGRFKINVKPGDTLLFTCIGYDIFSMEAKKYENRDSVF